MATKKAVIPNTPIREFMESYGSQGTGDAYRSGMLLFLDLTYGKIRKGPKSTKEEFEQYEKLAYRYLHEDRDHADDIVKFVQAMNAVKVPKKIPSNTIKIRQTAVREFLLHYRIALDDIEKREIKKLLPKARRATKYDYMSIDKIQAILPFCDIKIAALLHVLIASGARIGSIMSAKIEKLDLDSKPATLFIWDEKIQMDRTVFLTAECVDVLKKWIRSRDAYLQGAGKSGYRLGINKRVDDGRIFPFDETTARRGYYAALEKAGYGKVDGGTNRKTLNLHRARGFFKGATEKIVGADTSELLLGHIDKYGNAYKDGEEETLRKEYLKCEEALTVSTSVRIKRDMEIQAGEIQHQSTEIELLKAELVELQNDNKILKEALNLEKDDKPSLTLTLPEGMPAAQAQELISMVQAINAKLSQMIK
jgi:integrase